MNPEKTPKPRNRYGPGHGDDNNINYFTYNFFEMDSDDDVFEAPKPLKGKF
jgi:hypothetical protein